ncbi:MAG: ThuA domain-containing protein [Phycisphaeraceae bacterium]
MRMLTPVLSVLLAACIGGAIEARAEQPATPVKKIVLIAGKKSHGPEGNRIHDYPWSVRLIKVMLDNSNVTNRLKVEFHLDGWPKDPKTLDDADTIMVISDGRDGDKYEEAPHLQSAERIALIEKQMKRGCGFLTFHFSTFAPDQYARETLRWTGGYFDWETDGKRQWYSAIRTLEDEVQLGEKDHPILRGVKPFRMKEEFYYNIRFDAEGTALKALLVVPALKGREPDGNVVAWAKQRTKDEGGGRGFGTTCGHFYDNWKNDDFRRLILNAIVWTSGAEVPKDGVEAKYYEHDEITAAPKDITGTQRAEVKSISALILTGHDGPFHPWKPKTSVLQKALQQDARFKVSVTTEIEDLAKLKPGDYDVLILNYCNYQLPKALSDASKKAFVDYLSAGGGLTIVHFSNGAWHSSLPGAGETDWPEFRKICRRVWDHKAASDHDAYRKFKVDITELKHEITQGMTAWETTDELYFNQAGDEPIEALVTAVSQKSGKAEPLAWTYSYGKGRVFQTLLGHDDRSLMWGGTAELMRRGSVWAASREQRDVPRQDVNPKRDTTPDSAATPQAAQTRASMSDAFGKALAGGLLVDSDKKYREPITIECWAKLDSKSGFNILVASEPKSSPSHWELYSYAGSGVLSLYMPGRGGEYKSNVNICDGKWHHIAAVLDAKSVVLYIDGKSVLEKDVPAAPSNNAEAQGLAFGRLVEGNLGCDGLVDDVRISKGPRTIEAVTKPHAKDDATLGLWTFDDLKASPSAPAGNTNTTPAPPPAKTGAKVLPSDPGLDGGKGGHWGEKSDKDWVDDRLSKMQFGSMISHTWDTPAGRADKGMAIFPGPYHGMIFDSRTASMHCGWGYGVRDNRMTFLRFDPARFGLIGRHRIDGPVEWSLPKGAVAWQGAKDVRYRGMYVHHRGKDDSIITLHYEVDGVEILESLSAYDWHGDNDSGEIHERSFEFRPLNPAIIKPRDLTLMLADSKANAALNPESGEGVRLEKTKDAWLLHVAAPTKPARISVAVTGHADIGHLRQFTAGSFAALTDFKTFTSPGKLRWGKPIEVKGHVSERRESYVIDTIPVPYENPFGALMFLSGVDFFANGDAAVSTVHGDVWLVRGIDDKLEHITWQRFATGLFQPLGLRIVGDKVHVLGRDQITILHDRNNDGEADYYENFSSTIHTSPGGHDYVAALETDKAGNFYYVDPRGVHRITKDGKINETLATGFRNPNGMSVGPDGTITVAPQEGDWTPASMICQVAPGKVGNYFGYGGPRVTADRPLGYIAPLVYLPRLIDNSSGSQVWVTSDRWGPLKGQLLNLSFGRSSMQIILRDEVDGIAQGAVVPLPLRFLSGVMRGQFHPKDGQLYVVGMNGWVTNAARDGCFQRVRYTGKLPMLPLTFRAVTGGVRITFSQQLDKELAEDVESYAAEQWNYRYTGSYGSKDYSAADPNVEGHDEVRVRSAKLEADGRTVSIGLGNLQPVHQFRLRYDLETVSSESLRGEIVGTIHRIAKDK